MNTSAQPVNDSSNPAVQGNRHWPALREGGKIDRLHFTDAVKRFTEYVDGEGEGATKPDLAYSNFTRSVYAAFGLNKTHREKLMNGESCRDGFDAMDLRYLQLAESTAAVIIHQGIDGGASRKAIKTTVKSECGKIAGAQRRLKGGLFKGSEQ